MSSKASLAKHIPRDVFGEERLYVCKAFGLPELSEYDAYAGNPIGVCILGTKIPGKKMAIVAAKLDVPMTAFVSPGSAPDSFEICYFSADGTEFYLCGHATVGATKVISQLYDHTKMRFHLNRASSEFQFIDSSISGNSVRLSLPASNLSADIPEYLLKKILKVSNLDRQNVEAIFSSSIRDILVVLNDCNALRSIRLNYRDASELARSSSTSHRGIIFTAKSETDCYDIETRAFFPAWGIDEDIACGTANCSVVPYWHLIGSLRNIGDTYRVAYPTIDREGKSNIRGTLSASYQQSNKKVVICGNVTLTDSYSINL